MLCSSIRFSIRSNFCINISIYCSIIFICLALVRYQKRAPRGVTHSKAEERKQVTDLLNVYDIVSIDEWGYPDYLAYNGDGSTVLSWWVFRFVKKDTGEKVELFMHLSHNFNNDGKITNQVAYYNGNLLK